MANIQALRTCYTRLGFTQANSASIVDDKGIDSAAKLGFLKDEYIKALCKAVKRPVWTVENPDAENAGKLYRIPISSTMLAAFAWVKPRRV